MPMTICCLRPTFGWAPTRVLCQARGLGRKGEDAGFEPGRVIEI